MNNFFKIMNIKKYFFFESEKNVVIVGFSAAGILLKVALSVYCPNIKIFILEKNIITNKNFKEFFIRNPKFQHANVFSNLFHIIFNKYLKNYNKNLRNYFSYFNFKDNVTKSDFFTKLALFEEVNNYELFTGITNIKFNYELNKVKNIIFEIGENKKVVHCDYVFDCSGGHDLFFKQQKILNNLVKIHDLSQKTRLITFHVSIFQNYDKSKIDNLLSPNNLTISFEKYHLTVIKMKNYYSFTFVSSLYNFDKTEASKKLNLFLHSHLIYKYKANKALQWIHNKNTFLFLKNYSLVTNLIPVGDSFSLLNPRTGLGLTSILFQVIYICKRINREFSLKKYFIISYKFFLLAGNISKFEKKISNSTFTFFAKYKKYIPLYFYIKSFITNIKQKFYFNKCLKKL